MPKSGLMVSAGPKDTRRFVCPLSLYDNPNFIHAETLYESRQYVLPATLAYSDKNKTWKVEK